MRTKRKSGAGAAEIGQFRAAISADMDFTAANAAVRKLAKLRRDGAESAVKTRVAVLGNTTTTQISAFINLFLFAQQIDVEIYEAPYGLLRQEILDPTSDLYSFAPDFVVLATTRRDLGAAPGAFESAEAAQAAADAAAGEWEALWRRLHERLGCQIIQNNFDLSPAQAFGNLDSSHPAAPGYFIGAVNRALARARRAGFRCMILMALPHRLAAGIGAMSAFSISLSCPARPNI
ncbi:MAG: hypothetical protein NVV62_14315 [Terricaulis sp.]|nr:hypothetical protein [Terricaulis sp.]